MESDTYSVIMWQLTIASGMSLPHACLFVTALFNDYYSGYDGTIAITIKKENEKKNDEH